MEWIVLFGIPTAVTGLIAWWLKRRIEANEKKQLQRQQDLESLILMMMQTTRANTVGIIAIARAVQRIPDAHCNGDMAAALNEINDIQQQEKDFLINKGVKYIFDQRDSNAKQIS